jgi:hypothetical protein
MTNDFLESASELLDMSGEPYIIVVGRKGITKTVANFGSDNRKMLECWLESGHWNKILENHLRDTAG